MTFSRIARDVGFWLVVAAGFGIVWMLLPPRPDDHRVVPEGHEMPSPEPPSEPISPF